MKYTVNKRKSPTVDEVLEDIKQVMAKLGKTTLTIREYDKNGSYHSSTALRKIGTWNEILRILDATTSVVYYGFGSLILIAYTAAASRVLY